MRCHRCVCGANKLKIPPNVKIKSNIISRSDGKLYIKYCIMEAQYVAIMKLEHIYMGALKNGENIIQALYYIVRGIL